MVRASGFTLSSLIAPRSSAPTLAPGDIVVMDNLGSKLFYLPPYSPDLNPTEQVFAKLKHLLRQAAERTIEATWKRIGEILRRFTPAECANYLVNAGYAAT